MAKGEQVACKVVHSPARIAEGEAVRVHTGTSATAWVETGAATDIVTLATFPAPTALNPLTVYVVVCEGETDPSEALTKPESVQKYDVAAGVHVAASVEKPPALIMFGEAVSSHIGVLPVVEACHASACAPAMSSACKASIWPIWLFIMELTN